MHERLRNLRDKATSLFRSNPSQEELRQFIPSEEKQPVILRPDLLPVVQRLEQVVPAPYIWEHFTDRKSAKPHIFPYYRVDNSLILCRTAVQQLLKNQTQHELQYWYNNGSNLALDVLLWVEVGFEGIDNLAESPAAKNWTSTVGHFVSDAERVRGIKTRGAELYRDCLGEFARYRQQHPVAGDCFDQLGVAYLLDKVSDPASSSGNRK